MNRALIIEDEDEVIAIYSDVLADLGYSFDRAADGLRGVELALGSNYDFILLDLKLPELSGMDVCRQIRAEKKNVPILVVSSKTAELDRVMLLEFGADDYIVKPFSPAELRARIRAVLRRSTRSTESHLANNNFSYRGLEVDFVRRKVTFNDKMIDLTAREFDILTLLISSPGRPFSRTELNEELYGGLASGYEKSISNHINRMRTKLEPDPQNPIFIVTVRGVGYCFGEQ